MRSAFVLLGSLAVLAFAVGCSKSSGSSGSSGTTGSSGSSGGTTGGGDAGPVDAGPKACTSDSACTAPQICDLDIGHCGDPCLFDDLCPGGERCDTTSGHCIAAAACNDSVIASPVDACADSITDAGYCADQGNHCRCTTDGGGPGAGVCRRVRGNCDPCSSSAQCNPCPEGPIDCDPSNYVYPAQCAQVGDAGTYCLRTSSSQGCPFGYVQDPQSGTCQPQGGFCSGYAPCASDQDCVQSQGAGHYCDASTGLCKEFCTFNYLQGESVNCAPGQVCDVLPQDVLADAGLARYGVGTCAIDCSQPGGEDCASIGSAQGLSFACVQERSGEHRCRPVSQPDGGGCMDNVECAPTSDGGPYAGYCAIYQFACQYDCRDGVDPLTGQPYGDHDCQPPVGSSTGYECSNDLCVQKTCVELGGASHGATDQFCCGEDRDHTGYLDGGFADTSHLANACAPGVDAGEFFVAPAPPWCKTGCTSGVVNLPDGGQLINDFYTCSDAFAPNFDPLGSPNICLQYSQSDPADCVISAQFPTECPRNWTFGTVTSGCSIDTDCDEAFPDAGLSTLGKCNVFADGGGPHTCLCGQDEIIDGGYVWGGQCPNFNRCDTTHQDCIFTRGCLPNHQVCAAAP